MVHAGGQWLTLAAQAAWVAAMPAGRASALDPARRGAGISDAKGGRGGEGSPTTGEGRAKRP